MRVILDSNVLIAAFATRGLCQSVFEFCLDRVEIVSCPALLKEVESYLAEKLLLSRPLIREFIQFLEDHSTCIEVEDSPQCVCRDPDDDRLLGLAKQAKASFIITGDEDLLFLKKYGRTKIVTPRCFWEILRER